MVVPRSKINKEAKISIKFRNLGFIYIKIIFYSNFVLDLTSLIKYKLPVIIKPFPS